MWFRKCVFSLAMIAAFFSLATLVYAMSEEEKSFLSMYFTDEELQVISATRSLQSISRVADNIEVVTARDIELMNAHTLADVLNTVNGVQVSFAGAAPGSQATVSIQGSRNEHVVVLVDGVNINDISGGVADVSDIPVQMIERVEVIKGPASSVWGSSLGGIVNVITKAGEGKMKTMLSGDYGERNTGDYKAEVSGMQGAFGYYLFAGRLQSDGLRPHDDNPRNYLYSKLSYDVAKDTTAQWTLLYSKARNAVGDLEDIGLSIDTRDTILLSTLCIRSKLSEAVSIEVSGRTDYKWSDYSMKDLLADSEMLGNLDDRKQGASAKLDFKQGIQDIVFGADYDFNHTKGIVPYGVDEDIAAAYANDTISLGKLVIIPGLRFDSVDVKDTSLKEDAFSPSLGVTYAVGKETILRGVVAHGFNIPAVADIVYDSPFFISNPDLKLEKVWSYQVGAETGALKYLWLKIAGFRHDIKDAITEKDFDDGTWTYVNTAKARRQGVEAALKTVSFYGFSLRAAAAYSRTKDLATGEIIRAFPEYTYDVGLQYDDKKSFRALLQGRYSWWDNNTPDSTAKYNSFIFDFNAIKTVYKGQSYTVDAFITAHNIFDGSEYVDSSYKNANRWIEGGIRVKL
jgi:vitamin B12 transporter